MGDTILRDPLGRRVVLHDHTWHGHILQRHPEMRSNHLLVQLAVNDPIEIRYSDADPDCRLYFGDGPRLDTMIVVVADLLRGIVMTAHLVKAAKGAIEWSRPTH